MLFFILIFLPFTICPSFTDFFTTKMSCPNKIKHNTEEFADWRKRWYDERA